MPATSPMSLAALTPATPWMSRRFAALVGGALVQLGLEGIDGHRECAYPGDQVGGDPGHDRVHER